MKIKDKFSISKPEEFKIFLSDSQYLTLCFDKPNSHEVYNQAESYESDNMKFKSTDETSHNPSQISKSCLKKKKIVAKKSKVVWILSDSDENSNKISINSSLGSGISGLGKRWTRNMQKKNPNNVLKSGEEKK